VAADLHATFAWFVVVGNGLAGAWALAAHWWEPARVRALWIATAVVQVSIFVQVALGVVALGDIEGDPDQFHLFYGFVALATVGIIYSYRSQLAERRYLLYGGGGLFLMGLALRSMQFSQPA
tara:strand:- start:202 stop:567 length:366 start_codon:yes stop_codon:yes gene_type:complete